MRLESALYSSREGLSSHGQAISVVGDNVSNANTTGFKRSRAEFEDLLSDGGGGGDAGDGLSTGSGAIIGTVRSIYDGGVIESTGRALDVAVDGNGFFVVGDPAAPAYTRAGNFSVSKDGLIVNSNGLPLLGFGAGSDSLSTISVAQAVASGKATSTASVFGNLSSASVATTAPAAVNSFNELGRAASFSAGDIQIYDSLGQSHAISLYYFKTASNSWTARAYIDGGEVGQAKGTPVQLGADLQMNFGPDGRMAEADRAAAVITGQPAFSNGAAAGNFTLNLGGLTQNAGNSLMNALTQDGVGVSTVDTFEVTKDGRFEVVFENGQRALAANIPVATFTNIDGLSRSGSGLFLETGESGTRSLGVPGSDGKGELKGGSLERSSVDIANEFVDLVLYQRGYQANSQTFSAASSLIRDTINLIR